MGLDADTGELKWFYNHAPGESLDLDEVFERILIDHGNAKTVMTIGKAGILWKLDRSTGKFIDSRETVYQNVMALQNPVTGEPVTAGPSRTRRSTSGCRPAQVRRVAMTGRRQVITSRQIR